MLLFMRHGNDESNTEKIGNDNGLSDKGKEAIQLKTEKFIRLYGKPDEILCSPFMRCYETGKLLSKSIGKCIKCKNCKRNHLIPVKRDISLCKRVNDDNKEGITLETLNSDLIMNETDCDLHDRLISHINELLESGNIVWCITHAIIYKKIGSILGIRTSDHIKYLEHFTYKNKTRKVIM